MGAGLESLLGWFSSFWSHTELLVYKVDHLDRWSSSSKRLVTMQTPTTTNDVQCSLRRNMGMGSIGMDSSADGAEDDFERPFCEWFRVSNGPEVGVGGMENGFERQPNGWSWGRCEWCGE